MRKLTSLTTIFGLILILNSSWAMADASIKLDANQQQSTLLVKDNKVLVKEMNGQQDALFDAAKQTLYLIDHSNKTISPIDKQTIAQLAGQLAGAMSAVEKQMANLPPEQRAQIEAMMGVVGVGMPKQQALPTVTLESTGSKVYLDIKCYESNVLIDNQNTGTVCLSDGNSTPLSDQDYDTLLNTQAFMFSLAKEAAPLLKQLGHSLPQFGDLQINGLMVNSTMDNPQNPTQNGDFSIVELSTQELTEPMKLPEGYQTEDVMAQMQNGGLVQ